MPLSPETGHHEGLNTDLIPWSIAFARNHGQTRSQRRSHVVLFGQPVRFAFRSEFGNCRLDEWNCRSGNDAENDQAIGPEFAVSASSDELTRQSRLRPIRTPAGLEPYTASNEGASRLANARIALIVQSRTRLISRRDILGHVSQQHPFSGRLSEDRSAAPRLLEDPPLM